MEVDGIRVNSLQGIKYQPLPPLAIFVLAFVLVVHPPAAHAERLIGEEGPFVFYGTW